MSVRTRTRPTKKRKKVARTRLRKPKTEKLIPWREAFKAKLAKYSEGGLMLRGSRHKEEITQAELALAIGISQHHISEMENGKRPIGKEIAHRLAKYFHTDYRLFL